MTSIDRDAAIMTAMDYDGNGNEQDASQDIASAIGDIPPADVVPREQYTKLLKAAFAMHEWIFLNTDDEEAAYAECGLTDEMNALLGYGGSVMLTGGTE